MGRNSYRNIEEALALQARLKKREAFQQAEAEAAAGPMQAAFAAAGFSSQSYVSPVAGPRAEVL